ncbi:MAG: IS110 family transposase [Ignavibacteria bacterium]|nr:IS110 family transposase [Ignavibacteria bacterium]
MPAANHRAVHKRFISVTIYNKHSYHSKAHVPTAELAAYIQGLQQKHADCTILAAYEAGFCGVSLHRHLQELRVPTVVVNPADIPITDKQRTTKNDRSDSARIAQALSADALRGIWIPNEEVEGDRELVRYRLKMLRELGAIKNALKMRLLKHGIVLPKQYDNSSWSSGFRQWLREQRLPTPSSQRAFELFLDEYDHRKQRYADHLVVLSELAATPRYAYKMVLLTSIPGIGRLTALSLLTELGPVERFSSADQLASYVGLVPMQHQSGSSDRAMPMQRRAQTELRSMLIQCAWTAIRCEQHFTDLYERKRANKPGQKAIVTVARRLLNTVHAVLKNQIQYQRAT